MAVIQNFPHTVDLTQSRASDGCIAEHRPGEGWAGSDAMRCVNRPNDQGFAGYAEHSIPYTKRLNIRFMVKVDAANMPTAKWVVAIKGDDNNPRLEGCERFIATGHLLNGVQRIVAQQGVCTPGWLMPNLCGFDWRDHPNEWVCLESEADLNTGIYRVYISTADGAFNNAVWSEIDIATTTDPETVPNPYYWKSLDGIFWNDRNPNGYAAWISDMIVSDSFIGNPFSEAQPEPTPEPEPAPEPIPEPTPVPVPTPVLAPAYTGGRFHVMVNGVELSWHTQEKEAYESAGRAILNNPNATVAIQTDEVRVTLG